MATLLPTLRAHPATFLRADLRGQRIITCAEAMQARDADAGFSTAGLCSLFDKSRAMAKGVMFGGRDRYRQSCRMGQDVRKNCRVVLPASMVAVRGRIQREGEVVHLVAYHLADLSAGTRQWLGEVEAASSSCRTGAVMSSTTVAPASILARGSLRGRYHAISPCRIPRRLDQREVEGLPR